MLLHLQFPMSDLREIFETEASSKLPAPSWPSPIPGEEFVRSFGCVRRRRGGGLNGWISESQFCNAENALTWTRSDLRRVSQPGRLRPAFRRLYSDGMAMVKLDVGLACAYSERSLAGDEILSSLSSLPTIIRRVDGSFTTVDLSQAGRYIAELYERSTSCIRTSHPYRPTRLVRPEMGAVFIEISGNDQTPDVPKNAVLFSPFSSRGASRLFFWRSKFGESEILVWLLRKARPEGWTEEMSVLERELRIYLLRLNAEHIVLRRVVKEFAARQSRHTTDEDTSDTLQRYLNDAIRRVERYEHHANSMGDLENRAQYTARRYFSEISAGDFDALEQKLSLVRMRGNIRKKISQYGKSITVNNYVSNSTGVQMGDTYNVSGQAVNVGPGSRADHVVQNQDRGPDSELMSQLLLLSEQMGRRAATPEEQKSVQNVREAQAALSQGDEGKASSLLKKAGSWTLQLAKTIGLPLVEEYLKKKAGLG